MDIFDQKILFFHQKSSIAKFCYLHKIFFWWQNLAGNQKKWNWICILVFVIATWANRENYTVIFFHKILKFNKRIENILEKKNDRGVGWIKLGWKTGIKKKEKIEKFPRNWQVFFVVSALGYFKNAPFWPKNDLYGQFSE